MLREAETTFPPESDPVALGLAGNRVDGRLYLLAEYYDWDVRQSMVFIGCYDDGMDMISSTTFPGSGLGVGALAADGAGNVYYSGIDGGNNWVIRKYSSKLTGLRWSANGGGADAGESFSLAASPGGVAAADGREILHVSSDGSERWRMPIPGAYFFAGLAVDAYGNVYIGDVTADGNTAQIAKLKGADGSVDWTVLDPNAWYISNLLVDEEGRIYMVGYGGEYYLARYVQGVAADLTAPDEVTDLTATNISTDSITLSWTASGDDGMTGTASSYDIRYTTSGPVELDVDFDSATQAQGEPAPQTAGSMETFMITGLAPGTTYYFSLKTYDEAENVSGRSNSPKGITEAVSAKKYSLSGSTGSPELVVTNTYSPPLVSLVKISGTTIPAAGIGVDFRISSYPGTALGQSLSKSSETTDSQGVADVSLKLGNIPAEYGVTAACGSCEPSASSVTFTCCGKLPNDDFKQFDVKWATDAYNSICSTVPASSTSYRPVYSCGNAIFNNPKYRKYEFSIAAKGCGLSVLATLINHYRNAYDLPIAPVTPEGLNGYLNSNAGYDDDGSVFFNKVADWSNNRLVYVEPKIDIGQLVDSTRITRSALMHLVETEILSKRPVVIRIASGHFMLVVGLCEGNYIVSDPGTARRYMYDPMGTSKLVGVRRFKKL